MNHQELELNVLSQILPEIGRTTPLPLNARFNDREWVEDYKQRTGVDPITQLPVNVNTIVLDHQNNGSNF